MHSTTAPATTDPYVALHERLLVIHRAIVSVFTDVIAIDRNDLTRLVARATDAGSFLLGHHDAESHLLFPALRRSGTLRSSDVSFLQGLDREHHALHDLAERLVTETRAPHPRGPELITLSKEIVTAFALHTRGEENGLAPDRLRTMITLEGLEELARATDARR